MVQYQIQHKIAGMRLANSLIVYERFPEYLPKVGIVIAHVPDHKKKTFEMYITAHIWNEKDSHNKLESSMDVLRFGNDLSHHSLMEFLDACKREPLKSRYPDDYKRRLCEEVVELQNLVNSVVTHGTSCDVFFETIRKHTQDDALTKYYFEVKALTKGI